MRSTSSPSLLSVNAYRAKEADRKMIAMMELKFAVGDYLVPFITRAQKAMTKCTGLALDEQADMILPMLKPCVKARLGGKQWLVCPANPEQIFQGLRQEFPPSKAALGIALSQLNHDEREPAVSYLNRVHTLYMQHQVSLPDSHTECLTIYMRSHARFIKHCNDYRQTLALRDRLPDAEADAAPMVWDDFHALARKFDQEQELMTVVNKRPKSNELRALTGNQTTGSRTRSGRTDGVVNALDANPDHRGRSTERYTPRPRDASRPRSNSAGSNRDAPLQRSNSWKSNGSRPPSRERHAGPGRPWQDNPPRSPRTGPPGSTPHSKDFKKTPIERTASGNTAANASLVQIPGINWISVNLIRPLGQSSVDAEIDRDPIVISTLPGRQITDSESVKLCNATATRRPNLPEAINPDEMDENDKLLAIPEAMRRGLRTVQNLPVNNPYAKILNSQFMLSFRQLAGLCLDSEFAGICKTLLEVGLRKEGMQQSIATSRAAAVIFKLALM